VDDTLRNALVVKVGDFFAQDKIFQQRWAAFARAQRVLIVGNAYALIGGQGKIFAAFALVSQRRVSAVRIGRFQAARRGRLFAGAVGCGVGRQFWSSGARSRPGFASRHREPVIDGFVVYGVYQTLLVSCFHC
jgi:hypothetical protein